VDWLIRITNKTHSDFTHSILVSFMFIVTNSKPFITGICNKARISDRIKLVKQ
jgi:hypothetical protein